METKSFLPFLERQTERRSHSTSVVWHAEYSSCSMVSTLARPIHFTANRVDLQTCIATFYFQLMLAKMRKMTIEVVTRNIHQKSTALSTTVHLQSIAPQRNTRNIIARLKRGSIQAETVTHHPRKSISLGIRVYLKSLESSMKYNVSFTDHVEFFEMIYHDVEEW